MINIPNGHSLLQNNSNNKVRKVFEITKRKLEVTLTTFKLNIITVFQDDKTVEVKSKQNTLDNYLNIDSALSRCRESEEAKSEEEKSEGN